MTVERERKRPRHAFRRGNYAPIRTEMPLTPCKVVYGEIPLELSGGQYVRNGANPFAGQRSQEGEDDDEERDYHWFDGDGMLAGVLFRRPDPSTHPHQSAPEPLFVNRYVLTDLLLSTAPSSRRPILPSIATLIDPTVPLVRLILLIFRSLLLTLFSYLPSTSPRPSKPSHISRISVANTSITYHDGLALACCESGPPMRILLPGLETADWWTASEHSGLSASGWASGPPIVGFLREFTTAHPLVDPVSRELLVYHMTFVQPFLRVSVIPAVHRPQTLTNGKDDRDWEARARRPALLGRRVPGIERPTLMHSFAASRTHTVLLDLSLTLDPRNLAEGKPMVHYQEGRKARFGVFPRWEPERVVWFEDEREDGPCCVWHTVNAWNEGSSLQAGSEKEKEGEEAVEMLVCRLNSASLVYGVGNLPTPAHARPAPGQEERCELYYYRFPLPSPSSSSSATTTSSVSHAFPLLSLPFEFPTLHPSLLMSHARYIYGSSILTGSFDAGLGRAARADCIVKVDVSELIARGRAADLPAGRAVDDRSVAQILEEQREGDEVRVFKMPEGWYADEATFVPREGAEGEVCDEDEGYLVFYAFDERAGCDEWGEVRDDARSELWVLDAKGMSEVVCRIRLPQRVPYGLHGTFFSEEDILNQRPVRPDEVRQWALRRHVEEDGPLLSTAGKVEEEEPTWRTGALGRELAGTFRSWVEEKLA